MLSNIDLKAGKSLNIIKYSKMKERNLDYVKLYNYFFFTSVKLHLYKLTFTVTFYLGSFQITFTKNLPTDNN